jgi:hypothetical protein
MTIENNFEFVNSRELRRRFASTLATGRRNLTGAEYAQWAPSIEQKIYEIDQACEQFFVRLAFDTGHTISAPNYIRYLSSATSLTHLQPSVFSGSFYSANILTGASPESVAPPLFW